MSTATAHYRALQSVKAFRIAQVARRASQAEPAARPTKSTDSTRSKAVKPSPTTTTTTASALPRTNPFIVQRIAGQARPPPISLRRQAALAKQAHLTNTLHLLPPGPKVTALRLRQQRVQASLPAPLAELLNAKHTPADPVATLTARLRSLELSTKAPREAAAAELARLHTRARALRDAIAEFEIVSLVDAKKDSVELQAYHRKKEVLVALEAQIARHTARMQLAAGRVARLEKKVQAAEARKSSPEAAEVPRWQLPIKWVGEVPEKKTAGAELGIRLYAGKKRMFKGHLWERQREGRLRKRAVLMRDMAARVARYKEYYKKRKPNPLKPSRYSKPPKLPY